MTVPKLGLAFCATVLACICSLHVYGAVPTAVLNQRDAVVTIVISDKDGDPLRTGSGFIVKPEGVVITNYHVIAPILTDKRNKALVKMENGGFFPTIDLVNFDTESDLAVLQLDASNLHVLKLGSKTPPKVGDDVYVIGSPKGLETTVSHGIISSLRKQPGVIQITAPISPGSSGSPVFNSKGEVIGIATFVVKDGQNLNFAIPVNKAVALLRAPPRAPEPESPMAKKTEPPVPPKPEPPKSPFDKPYTEMVTDTDGNKYYYIPERLNRVSRGSFAGTVKVLPNPRSRLYFISVENLKKNAKPDGEFHHLEWHVEFDCAMSTLLSRIETYKRADDTIITYFSPGERAERFDCSGRAACQWVTQRYCTMDDINPEPFHTSQHLWRHEADDKQGNKYYSSFRQPAYMQGGRLRMLVTGVFKPGSASYKLAQDELRQAGKQSEDYSHSTILYEFDCKEKTFKVLNSLRYNSKGGFMNQVSSPGDAPKGIPKGSVLDILRERYCK